MTFAAEDLFKAWQSVLRLRGEIEPDQAMPWSSQTMATKLAWEHVATIKGRQPAVIPELAFQQAQHLGEALQVIQSLMGHHDPTAAERAIRLLNACYPAELTIRDVAGKPALPESRIRRRSEEAQAQDHPEP